MHMSTCICQHAPLVSIFAHAPSACAARSAIEHSFSSCSTPHCCREHQRVQGDLRKMEEAYWQQKREYDNLMQEVQQLQKALHERTQEVESLNKALNNTNAKVCYGHHVGWNSLLRPRGAACSNSRPQPPPSSRPQSFRTRPSPI